MKGAIQRVIAWMKNAANQGRYDRRQTKYLPRSSRLEDNIGTAHVILGISTVCVVVFALIAWSIFINIAETADADGELMPKNKIQIIQHLEGGIVRKIFVKNGQHVKAGQALVALDNVAATAELEQFRAKELSLLIDAERLRAYLQGDKNKFTENLKKLLQSEKFKKYSQINSVYNEEKILLQTQSVSRDDKQSVIKSQIEKEKDAIKQLNKQKYLLEEQIVLLQKEQAMYHELKSKAFFSEREYLKILREVNSAKRELVKLNSQIDSSNRSHQELNNKLNQLNSGLRETASQELGSITTQLLQTQHKIQKLEDRVRRHAITSPVNGVVKGIEVSPGSVIGPGHNVLEVVPQDANLVAEVRITTRDIGHISIGDPVNLKILTYDFARYGAVKGTLETVSATSYTDDKNDGEPYFKGTVKLKRQYLIRNDKKLPLKSGMTVQASITTGNKTLFEYIVKPIKTTLGQGFHER